MLGFISAHNLWNAISYLERQWSYKALRDDLVLPSTMTVNRICQREYAKTLYATEKQLPSQNQVSLALDGWTSMNTQAITLVVAYCMNRNRAMCNVQMVFDDVDRLFFSAFKT
jgi:hypothetical protein